MKKECGKMKRNVKQNNRSVGAVYEQAAGYYLEQNGYELIEYNYRCRDGEIDIIAKTETVMCFASEISFRQNRSGESARMAVDQRKQKKIFRCALYYTVQHGIEDAQCRFDVIGVEGTEITHIKNAFVG